MKVLVRRTGALGDVILTTPVVQRLRREGHEVHVQTAYPIVFDDLACVTVHADAINKADGGAHGYDKFINLDLAYEKRPRMHIVRAYMQEAFGDDGTGHSLQQVLRLHTAVPLKMRPRTVVLHCATGGWPSRSRDRKFWRETQSTLIEEGFTVIVVGRAPHDAGAYLPDVHDWRDIMFLALHRLIASAKCFVGMDSGLLHIAGATSTPIVGLFTCADPAYRMPLRENVRDTVLLPAGLGCLGCLHDIPPPVTTMVCRRDDTACTQGVQAVPPADILAAVRAIVD
jgi:ADP-heptose:LPS heptosyltransferase